MADMTRMDRADMTADMTADQGGHGRDLRRGRRPEAGLLRRRHVVVHRPPIPIYGTRVI